MNAAHVVVSVFTTNYTYVTGLLGSKMFVVLYYGQMSTGDDNSLQHMICHSITYSAELTDSIKQYYHKLLLNWQIQHPK